MRIGSLILALALVVMASAVMAAEVNVDITVGGSTTYTDTTEANTSVTAGYVHQVDITVKSATGYWAGIYGTVSGQYVLGDETSNLFTWTVSQPSGYILIALVSTPNFASLATVGNASELYTYIRNDLPSWSPDADQNVDQTFTNSVDTDCNYAGLGATLSAHVEGNWMGKGYWPVCAYTDGTKAVFASPIDPNGVAYDGTTSVDYEAIVPAETGGTTVLFFKG